MAAACWSAGLWGNDFAGYLIKPLPAVLLLAGDDEDLLACPRFAISGGVEIGGFHRVSIIQPWAATDELPLGKAAAMRNNEVGDVCDVKGMHQII